MTVFALLMMPFSNSQIIVIFYYNIEAQIHNLNFYMLSFVNLIFFDTKIFFLNQYLND